MQIALRVFWFNWGLVSGDVVCLSGIKSVHTFALILACLKTGVIYSVFDPDSPFERLRKIFLTCRPRLVVANTDLLQSLSGGLAELMIASLSTDDLALRVEDYEDVNLLLSKNITGTTPGYIMFTSAPRGFPKVP
jgi:non-ribosomal peptide synthetase component F